MAAMTEPWSKKHKQVTRAGDGGMSHSLSNSYAEPLTHAELVEHALARGDRAIVEAYNDHGLGYTPNGGSLDLREEIAQLYGPAIGPENILVFTGAQVALQTAALALARDCHSIVFTPGYQSTVEAAVHAGGEVTQIQLEATRGWQIDPEQVKAAIRPNTRYMVLNEPYNPAGTLMSHELQAEIMSIAGEAGNLRRFYVPFSDDGARSFIKAGSGQTQENAANSRFFPAEAHGIVILSDEVYRLLEHDAQDRLPAMADVYARGISAVTVRKRVFCAILY
jgi:aspartate/methionine/tyrosine aminotransferase